MSVDFDRFHADPAALLASVKRRKAHSLAQLKAQIPDGFSEVRRMRSQAHPVR